MKILKKPKFDITKLMELHQDSGDHDAGAVIDDDDDDTDDDARDDDDDDDDALSVATWRCQRTRMADSTP